MALFYLKINIYFHKRQQNQSFRTRPFSFKMQESVTFQALGGAEDRVNATKVQFIPAKMELPSSGKAPIHTYFDQYTEQVDGELTNALRGYPLNGRKFKTPDGILGVVYEENKTKLSETNRTLKVNSVFNEYVYWNYDKIPSDNDAITKALDWFEISKSFQQPIDPSELAKFTEDRKKAAALKVKSEENNGQVDE